MSIFKVSLNPTRGHRKQPPKPLSEISVRRGEIAYMIDDAWKRLENQYLSGGQKNCSWKIAICFEQTYFPGKKRYLFGEQKKVPGKLLSSSTNKAMHFSILGTGSKRS